MNLSQVCDLCLFVLAASLGLTLYRLLKGPSVPDKIAALDLTASISIITIGVVTIKTRDSAYLDVAVVLAIVAFLGTISFARYLEKRRLSPKQ